MQKSGKRELGNSRYFAVSEQRLPPAHSVSSPRSRERRLQLKRALNAGATFIGINNRNLARFQVDLRTTEVLTNLIPGDCVAISESGIRSVEDVRRVVGAGVDGVLIGESLMRAENPRALLESFRAAVP